MVCAVSVVCIAYTLSVKRVSNTRRGVGVGEVLGMVLGMVRGMVLGMVPEMVLEVGSRGGI